ncbi:TIGR02186 family protein [Sandaracinobacteroides saxicola]|uniref:TIGR02186 family protein n=1 Tax=Sandaracinobacteroides saxicola TaxID=2759707 RepID=A0A7G5II23_9SPHN|nr:TIGR02186 family protein [Sandaracinobacteroides saxicola]QMW23015.1 TIGR02186 family protein [Sandaracinobacteroides saxicola]
MIRALLLWLLWAGAALAAEPRLVTDLSQSRIDISYRFAGAELLIYGAIQYPGGRTPGDEPGIAIVVRGPTAPLTLRQKERIAGIWMNTRAVRFESAPGFYAVATTAPVRELLDERNAAIYEIGLQHLQLSPATAVDPATTRAFQDGLLALRARAGLYVEQPGGVRVTENVLYRARIPIPSAVPVGEYRAEIYLIRKGRVLARSTTPIVIDKTGFERGVWRFAQEHSIAYGLLAVGIALFAGWAAGLVTRRKG